MKAWPWRRSLAITALCVLFALFWWRDPIGRAVFPDAAVAGLVARGDAALLAEDAFAASESFRAAEARDPDHPRVAEGLAAARELALSQASRAIADGAVPEADRLLALAVGLGAPGERLEELRRARDERAQPSPEIMLAKAAAAESTDPESALLAYSEVLSREPGNAVARDGQRRMLGAQLAEARLAIARGDLERASTLVDGVRARDPGHLDLLLVETALGAALRERPLFHEGAPLPAVDPEAVAQATRWRGRAEEAIGRGAVDEARRALDEAARLDPGHADLPALEQRLALAAPHSD